MALVGAAILAVGLGAGGLIFGTRNRTAQAKNRVSVAIDDTISIINSTVLQCSGGEHVTNVLNITCTCQNYCPHVSHIEQQNWVKFTTACVQKATTDTNLDQQIKTQMAQMAKAVSTMVALSASQAENIANLTEQLGVTVKNNYLTSCIQKITAANTINVREDGNCGAPIVASYITQSNLINNMQQCMQQSTTVNSIKQDIFTIIDQTAIAKVDGFLTILLALLTGLAVLFFAFEAFRYISKKSEQGANGGGKGGFSLFKTGGKEHKGGLSSLEEDLPEVAE